MKKTILIFLLFAVGCQKMNPEKEAIIKRTTPPPSVDANRRPTEPYSGAYTLAFGTGYNNMIEGVRTTFNIENLGNEAGRSAWCSGLIKKPDDGTGVTDSANWFQMGIQENAIPVIQSYYTPVTEVTIINSSVPVVKGRRYTFYLKHIGNNYWETGRQPEGANDIPVLRFKGCAGIMHNPQTGIEYYASNAKFPTLNFNKSIELYVNGQWVQPVSSYLTYSGRFGAKANGVNNISMGSAIPKPSSTFLW